MDYFQALKYSGLIPSDIHLLPQEKYPDIPQLKKTYKSPEKQIVTSLIDSRCPKKEHCPALE